MNKLGKIAPIIVVILVSRDRCFSPSAGGMKKAQHIAQITSLNAT